MRDVKVALSLLLKILMAPFPNNPNDDPFSNLPQERPEYGLSTARAEAAKKQARKWFAILLTIGLVLGVGMAIGVVKILNQLGLTPQSDRPAPIESPRRP